MNLAPIRRLSQFSDTKLSHLQLKDRSLAIATLLGIAIGTEASLPTTATNDNIDVVAEEAISFFNNVISNINEVFVIDVSTVLSVAIAIFKHRYNTVYNYDSIVDGLKLGVYTDVIGLPSNISALVNNHLEKIHFYEMHSIIREIKENILT